MSKPRINLEQQKFGRLTVIEFSHVNKHKHTCWKCQCDCGNDLIVSTNSLRKGRTRSCGCLQIEELIERSKGSTHARKSQGESGFSAIYTAYRQRAKVGNKYFDNSLEFKEEFRRLTKQNCFHCGREPYQLSYKNVKGMTPKGIENSKYIYNGLDRIDSDKGYEFGNVVTCCGKCNKSKLDDTEKEHNDWLIISALHKINTGQIKLTFEQLKVFKGLIK
jgi:hypothetical protein